MKLLLCALAAFVCLSFIPSVASAEDGGFYLEAKFGMSS
jgi:hypothetical protein